MAGQVLGKDEMQGSIPWCGSNFDSMDLESSTVYAKLPVPVTHSRRPIQ
jgi:hypothetical protein